MAGFYLNQLKALLKRNLLIKKSRIYTTLLDFLFPILIAVMLVTNKSNFEIKFYPYGNEEPTSINEMLPLNLNSPSLSNVNPVIGFILPKNYNDETIIYKVMESDILSNIKPIRFENQEAMNEYKNDQHNYLLASIIFEKEDYSEYTLRVNSTYVPIPNSDPIGDYAESRYLSSVEITDASKYAQLFTPIQTAVDQAIIKFYSNNDNISVHYKLGTLGKAAIDYYRGDVEISGISNYYIVFMFMFTIISITLFLVQEKEKKLKDGLLITGVHPFNFWLSWLIIYFFMCLIICVISTIIIVIGKVYEKTNPLLIFIGLFLYSLTCCNMAFFFSTFFKKTKTANSVVGFIYIFLSSSTITYSMIEEEEIKLLLSFIYSPFSLSGYFNEFGIKSNGQPKVTLNNIFTSKAGIHLLGLLSNVISYFLIAIIVDTLFTRKIQLFKSKNKIMDLIDDNRITYQRDIMKDFHEENNEKCEVEVSRVYKIFKKKNNKNDEDNNNKSKKGEFLAVNDVSFKVYNNEIFAILGHNGAGKTTLINIMVGLLKSSKGDVYFSGRSISKKLNTIRKEFGVCTQTNIIYDELTVEEHIKFYAELRNVKVNIDEVLKEVDLTEQKNTKASKLSGGQKRKLCISMAIIGNPKYIFLDEPTTGLDPLSRRKIWELLLKKKEGRVIFLTTHYMDEADILADRKLILNEGRIRCLGTSLYLKNHFNMNYNLNVETISKNKDYVHSLIQHYIPQAVYMEDSEKEKTETTKEVNCYIWRLPLNTTSQFQALLNELDSQMNSRVIKKYALSMPTLEELFIRLEDNNTNDDNSPEFLEYNDKQHLIEIENQLPQLKNVKKPSKLDQIRSLVHYRFKLLFNNRVFAFNTIVLPVLLTAGMFVSFKTIFDSINEETRTNPTIISVPSMYNDVFINYDSQSSLSLFNQNNVDIGINYNNIKSMPLNNVPYQQVNENYYLSSIRGEEVNGNYNFQVHYNESMTHSIPASINAISNAILASKNINKQIVVKSYPYKESNNFSYNEILVASGLVITMMLIIPLSKYGPLATVERVKQIVQQLQLNGVSRKNYWLSNFLTDYSLYLLICILMLLTGVIARFDPLLDIKVFIIIIIMLVIWSIPVIFYQYLLSFLFKNEDTASNLIIIINVGSIFIGSMILNYINLNSKNSQNSVINNNVLEDGLYSLKIIIINLVLTAGFPTYGFYVISNALFLMKLSKIELNVTNLMKYKNAVFPTVIILIALGILYFIALLYLDRKVNRVNKSDIHELRNDTKAVYEKYIEEGDDDIKKEFHYVKRAQKTLPISVLHLSKEYKMKIPNDRKSYIKSRDPNNFRHGEIHVSPLSGKFVKTAVIDVNFGVRPRECFGLLGPNGAGKSTTLNTISSTVPQTTGKICFNGIETHLASLSEISLGYCPQNDILWKDLTLREHIELYLRIRGYSAQEAKEYATQYINIAGIEKHQNKRTVNLSGGTKRKLSLIIAICGYPKQILLDEPTAGMDPSTRRFIWNIIKKSKSMNDSALILTTHSMEEAENLCDRLAILVNGRLTCIGSPEHLKMKFGDSYVLEVQSNNVDKFHSKMIESSVLFRNKEYKMERNSSDRIKYEVKMTNDLGYIFSLMEQCKSKGLVNDYSFSQTTLEQVFINFAKQQNVSEDA